MIDFVVIPKDRMRILRDKLSLYTRKLGNFFEVRIRCEGEVEIEGEPDAVLRAKEIIKAFGRGFKFEDTLDLVDENYVLEVIETPGFSGKSKNRQIELKGRVIGTEGKSKNIIQKYSGTKIAVHGKTVSIIGTWDQVKLARKAVEMLLEGAKHATVFQFLEDNRIR